jgi:hypothetical protein
MLDLNCRRKRDMKDNKIIKYPVYFEVTCLNSGHGFRHLLESREELGEVVAALQASSKETGLQYSIRFAGYPSVVGDLPLGPIE